MKRFDDMTVKTSWLLVLVAFTLLVLGMAGLAAYAVHDAASTTAGMDPARAEWFNVGIIAGVIATLVLAAIVLWGVSVNVIRPLERLMTHCERLAEGDLSHPVEKRGNNEIGRLFKALGQTQAHLSNTVGDVRRACTSVHDGAAEIARGNTDLSSRTEQQAASLEQTAASMEELTSTVRQNAENAAQANQLADDASAVANRGGEVVSNVVDTMHEISQQSHQAVELLDAIDSVAFQTNILALNASVEAARAGEQGRGFAVVANEVQTLAKRSADAAKAIRDLIQRSAERVESGAELADKAGTTMGDIVTSITRVNEIMREIAAASEEQSHGISQVDQAVSQMDQVTQQNASLVQQAAGAARALTQQADELQTTVAVFRLADSPESPVTQALQRPAMRVAPAPGAPTRPSHRTTPQTQSTGQDARTPATVDEWESF
ncbi:methyl-accepting chemotaxis protein [Salinicola aestuarinus]|uniref:methyl-accepting chemotaxis protein n=1 Tax=Salinicola aestuarinus TaxID=1949082 RepID=UPI0024781D9B|nr:methyl-accepting chemotaxis protein [Salinicola aestuarinus]